jgi:NAD(P)H dehydrogenase (quinone)
MTHVRLVIVYYSATGTGHRLAEAAHIAAETLGAEVRLRKVPELTPAHVIDDDPDWRAHLNATAHIPEVTRDDLRWANAYLFGSPTRFGNVAGSFKQFMDSTGGLWAAGELSDKPAAAFTSAQNLHGGQETTLLALYNMLYHWGAIIVPPGYTDERVFAAGGNPYGVSATADGQPLPESALAAMAHLTERRTEAGGAAGGARRRITLHRSSSMFSCFVICRGCAKSRNKRKGEVPRCGG